MALALLAQADRAQEWPRFRGPNGSGISSASRLPVEFGPSRNMMWKTDLPPGHSSPVTAAGRIFLTAFEGEGLLTLCLDLESGRTLWRKAVTRTRTAHRHPLNNPASPSAVTDGDNVYVFFQDFGLLSYSAAGEERWRLPLGPFQNNHGMGASPILSGELLILASDQDVGSFLLAVAKDSGAIRWRTDRSEILGSSYCTPIVYDNQEHGPLLIMPGSFQLAAYRLADGEKVWWVQGLPYSPRGVPVIAQDENGEDLVVTNVQTAGDGEGVNVPSSDELLKSYDKDGDGLLTHNEVGGFPLLAYGFPQMDVDGDGLLTAKEWDFRLNVFQIPNLLMAVRPVGRGDLTKSQVRWRYHKSLPNVPSPLIYNGVLYLLKEGGIVTSLDPTSGEVFKQGRLLGALDAYYASPVAADGKIYMLSQAGRAVVVEAVPEWRVLAINELGEECIGTPAIVDACR